MLRHVRVGFPGANLSRSMLSMAGTGIKHYICPSVQDVCRIRIGGGFEFSSCRFSSLETAGVLVHTSASVEVVWRCTAWDSSVVQ